MKNLPPTLRISGIWIFLLLSLQPAFTQSCYERYRSGGIASYEAMEFDSAIYKFKAALICDNLPRNNDINDWIIKAQNGYIDAINEAKKAAEEARDAEALARLEAETNAARARFNALNAKALLALNKQDPNTAFALAQKAKAQAQADSLSNRDLSASVLPEVYYNGFFSWEGGFYSPPFYQDLDTFSSRIESIDLHPDGDKLLLTLSQQPYAQLLDTRGSTLRRFSHEQAVHQAHFSPDGKQVLTASREGELRLWDLQGNVLQQWQEGPELGSVGFSPDGKSLLIASGQGKVSDRQGKPEGKPFGEGIYEIVMSPDRNYIFTLSGLNAQLWQWQEGKGARLRYTFSRQPGIGQFSPDSRHLLTASRDSLQIWKIEKGGKKLVSAGSLSAHNGYLYDVTFSQDGKYVITAGRDQQVALWSLAELLQAPNAAKPLLRLRGHQAPVQAAILAGQGVVYSGGDDRRLKQWDLHSKPIPSLADHSSGEWVRALAVSPVNGQLALGLEGRMLIKDPQTLKIRGEAPLSSPLVNLTFSHDGSFLAGISREGDAIVWAWEKGMLKEVVRRHFPGGRSLAFSPDDSLLAVIWLSNASVWDWRNNQFRISLDHHEALQAVAVAPEGKQWLVTSFTGKAWLWPWEMEKPDPLALPPHNGAVLGAAFSPDGKTFLTTSLDGAAWIHNGEFSSLIGHTGSVLSGAFSPKGQQLATCSADGLVILWNLQGEELYRLPRLTTYVEEVHFSPDGRYLYLRDSAGRALQWDLEP